eukprot:gnl/TRDRNA2_/TRDRNA2_191499_c0_seq1.p1 gnl/TRDRNA2_/TRDRNA2_191499_c0~~gnl/TRDRNA2_/TRDRNA2_191499_c0_seq1.p1  ORF type:complete len:410 (+),score=82.57 gnl/TRDRNA2_/TRDRNA2_191499_c0_seq1:69-1232(+)
MRCTVSCLLVLPPLAHAFSFEDLFSQAQGGGGQAFHFEMGGGGDPFEQFFNGGGGHRQGRRQQQRIQHPQEPEEPEVDLYKALGLDDDASEADIKKAYRKLSIKYHPDKNPDEASKKLFNEVRDAYELLNDPDKKILYDTGGMKAVKAAEKGEVGKTDDIGGEIQVALEELYNGGETKAHLDRRTVCRGCRVRPKSEKCKGCKRCPDEVETVHVQVGPGMFMQQQQQVKSKEKCRQDKATLDVQVERGMRDGERVSFPRMAEERPGMIPGDVVLTMKQRKHPKFERRGNNLHMTIQISLIESLLGWSQTIRHLDGHTVELSCCKDGGVTKPFQHIVAKGEGMPLRDDPASFGDLVVKVQVTHPKKLTDAQKAAVQAAFEPPAPRSEL